MRVLLASIEGEYRRYKSLAEGAFAQVSDALLCERLDGEGNSIATICWHVSGNLASRFTEFLTTDGEKSWRAREEEFAVRSVKRAELITKWEAGWKVLLDTLATLSDEDLTRTVFIRKQPLAVHEALHRSLAHASYHVGQIVFLAKSLRGKSWKYLSIPPGMSDEYNKNPNLDKPDAYVARVSGKF